MSSAMKFGPAGQDMLQARYAAQRIAFGPVVFQCVYIAWKWGVLDEIGNGGSTGVRITDLAGRLQVSAYAIDVLLQSCLSAGVVSRSDEQTYMLTKVGHCILRDRLTQTNLNFVRDVCYVAINQLEESLRTETPLGLTALGDWPTLYDGLAEMAEPARSSWLQFDHFYSDNAFPVVLGHVFGSAPRRILDIGANTGKWALQCLQHDPQVQLVLVDLPGQLDVARGLLEEHGHGDRVLLEPMNVLERDTELPSGIDVAWMSQFLVCFSDREVVTILRKVADCLDEHGCAYILDTFWDRQHEEVAAYCLLNTTPYFTAIAKGNSKIYAFSEIVALAGEAGLRVEQSWDGLGICHSLIRLRRSEP